MNRRDKVVGGIDVKNKVGLEIGPLHRPFVKKSEGEIVYVDYLDTSSLRKKFKDDPEVNTEEIVEVDVVCNQVTLLEALGDRRFDYVIASHVIEHVPDVISWLEALAQVLKPDGEVRLAVPDRRFTFDYLRQETRISDVVDAYLRKAKVPLCHSVLDHCCNQADVDVGAAWRGEVDVSRLKKHHTGEGALYVARDALEHGTYHDVHCWTFTPRSFAVLFEEIAKLGFLQFLCARLIDTERNDFEFFVSLRSCSDQQRVIESWRTIQTQPFAEPGRATETDARILRLEAELNAITTSSAWRWTAPLRRIQKVWASRKR